MLELIYTASPVGLDPSRSGFVTVARTEGFPPNLLSPLENLSGYKALYPPEDPRAGENPANYSFQRYGQGAGVWYVISRISYAGLSYTGRSNNLAHHLVFKREELSAIPGGAAAILADDANFPKFEGQPRLLGLRHCHGWKTGTPAGEGSTWARLCGNGDWARVIAERFRADRTKGVVLQFTPGVHCVRDILSLVAEVVELLSPEEAIDFTFSTYCYQSTIGNPVYFRAYTEESPYLASARRMNPRSIIVLGKDNPFGADEEQLMAKYQERLQREREAEEEREAMKRANMFHKMPTGSYGDELPMNKRVIHEHAGEVSVAKKDLRLKTSSFEPPMSAPVARTPEARRPSWGLIGLAATAVLAFGAFIAVFVLGDSSLPREKDGVHKETKSVSEAQSAGLSGTPEDAPVPKTPSTPSTPAEKTAADEQPEQPPEPPVEETVYERPDYTDEEKLAFFENFQLDQMGEIPLPKRFSQGGMLSVEVDGIGNMNSLPKEATTPISENNRCVVCAIQREDSGLAVCWDADPENVSGQMVLEIRDGKLCVKEPAVGEQLPSRKNITRILVDNEVLYEREVSDELLKILDKSCKVSGGLFYDVNDKRLYIRVEEVPVRLEKYHDYVRLVARVSNERGEAPNPKHPEYNLELASGKQAEIAEFKTVAEIEKLVRQHSEKEEALGDKREELEKHFKSIEGEYQQWNNTISNIQNSISMDFKDMKIFVKKGEKEEVELEKIGKVICDRLNALKDSMVRLNNQNEKLNGNPPGFDLRCLGDLKKESQKLLAANNKQRQNFNNLMNKIGQVDGGVRKLVRYVESAWKKRYNLEKSISQLETGKEQIKQKLSDERKKLPGELSPYLSQKKCNNLLGTDVTQAVVSGVLQVELLESCKVEFSLMRK